MMKSRAMRLIVPLLCLGLTPLPAGASNIAITKHNLSVSGPGGVKAVSETRICVFCHTPHNASPDAQLWNRNASGATYTPYTSSTLDATPGQPTGSSKLCLSCHDGTIALGEVLSEASPISMAGGITTMPAGVTNLGIVLTDDHPFSFAYTPGLAVTDGQLNDPATLTQEVKLDANGELQCTSCHDAHDDTYGKFLVADNVMSAVCQSCHSMDYWDTSFHALSAGTWNGVPPDPWPHTEWTSVRLNACENCHNPHNAGSQTRLLNYLEEETNCLVCHNGNVADTDIDSEFQKMYVHPVTSTTGVHDPKENPVVTTRHAECFDCHNPHAVTLGGYNPPLASGHLRGVKGIDTDGNPVDPVNNEYEVCYKCHADSPGKPGPKTARQIVQDNVRLEFDPGNPSYHPVEAAGVNPDVPSLKSPWTTSSIIYCTDCHNNDAGPRAGGAAPDGPHGSIYPSILGWQFETADNTPESAAAYELCYRCHDRTSILADASFKEHKKHIQGVGASCNICHDPHGVSSTQGNITNNSHLINFNTAVVLPDPNSGLLEYRDTDPAGFKGECYLKCHNVKHSPKKY
jgi:predicted CXXCH cytochrome family protein